MKAKRKKPNAQKWTQEIVSGHLLEIEKEVKEGYTETTYQSKGKLSCISI